MGGLIVRKFAQLLALLTALIGNAALSASPGSEDARFAQFVDQTLDEFWRLNPEDAFAAGYYKYADLALVPDAEARAKQLKFDAEALTALATFDERQLSAAHRVDLILLRNQFEADQWYTTVFRGWQWQPSQYNVADGFARQLDTNYAPYDTRLKHILARLERVPAYYAAAKANLDHPTLEHTMLAIEQNQGALDVFGDELMSKVESSNLSRSDKDLLMARAAAAKAAIADYIAFLTSLKARLDKGGGRNFRIGKDLYAQKFAYDIQSGYTVEQLYQMATVEKASLHERMEVMARGLWPKYMGNRRMPSDRLELIAAVNDALSKHHAAPNELVETVRKQIPELEKFVRAHDLVDLDPTRPLIVRETPVYQRGVAGAGVETPGPYDPTANTYYNVTPLDGYAPEQAESYMREYNDWMLQLLSMHEAIPGHYLQFVHANKNPSPVKSVFGNGALIEGWAVFGERMMLDAGYGGGTQEMWLAWMKWNLRAVCNTIIDVEIQTGDLDHDKLVSFLTHEAFQSEAEAEEKWRRATLTQVQLVTYYDGYAEITALRDEERARLGKDFSIKNFNNRFLSYGNAPVRYIKQLMHGEDERATGLLQ